MKPGDIKEAPQCTVDVEWATNGVLVMVDEILDHAVRWSEDAYVVNYRDLHRLKEAMAKLNRIQKGDPQ